MRRFARSVLLLALLSSCAQEEVIVRSTVPLSATETAKVQPTQTPDAAPTPSPAAQAATPEPTAVPTPVPACSASDFDTSVVPDARSHHEGGTFRFIAKARNVSGHDCRARTGFGFGIKGPAPRDQRVFGWAIHGDFWAPNLPEPWHSGHVESSEFEWQTKHQHLEEQPVEPGDYVVTAWFCPGPVDPQTGDCSATASTTVTVEPAAAPSPVP